MYPLRNFIIVNLDCATIPEERRLPKLTERLRHLTLETLDILEIAGVYKNVNEVSYLIRAVNPIKSLWRIQLFRVASVLQSTFNQETVLVDLNNIGFLVGMYDIKNIGVLTQFNPDIEKHDGYSVIDGRHFTYKGGTGNGLNYSIN